jgi:hypothetical protein
MKSLHQRLVLVVGDDQVAPELGHVGFSIFGFAYCQA